MFTVSIHCQKNFPAKKATSNLDLGLNAGIGDDEYLAGLDRVLLEISQVPADLIIYNAGVDVHKNDNLGHLCVSSSGITMREKKVLDFVKKRKLPFVVTLGGGYQKNVANLSYLHSIIFQEIIKGFGH